MSRTRPRLLDLYSCAGGAAAGYHRAGFEVVGIDLLDQPRYPYPFHRGDALDLLQRLTAGEPLRFTGRHGENWVYGIEAFDVIHASPPCQAYSVTKHAHDNTHPDLLEPTRAALIATGLPYVIENVIGAPLHDPLTLCGTEFGLTAPDIDGRPVQLRRHRLFESNVWLMGAGGCYHDPATPVAGSYTGSRNRTPEQRDMPRLGGYTPHRTVRAALLDIDWMNEHELAQAIPPAYAEHIGGQLIAHLAAAPIGATA